MACPQQRDMDDHAEDGSEASNRPFGMGDKFLEVFAVFLSLTGLWIVVLASEPPQSLKEVVLIVRTCPPVSLTTISLNHPITLPFSLHLPSRGVLPMSLFVRSSSICMLL